MRYRQETDAGERTYYVDKLMEIITVGTSTDYRHYLSDVAILTKTGDLNDPNPGIDYTLRDRLGSVAAIVNASGTSSEPGRAYDPFGKPRNADWTDKTIAKINSSITDRGFTEHEHLDDWQLIHMNGRGYDYNLGRFLSVDPIIQSPGNSQSLNPFTYIMNNPLSGTDPSGYCAAATGTHISDCGDLKVDVSVGGEIIGSTVVKDVNFANGADVSAAMAIGQGRIAGALKSAVFSSNGSGSDTTEFGSVLGATGKKPALENPTGSDAELLNEDSIRKMSAVSANTEESFSEGAAAFLEANEKGFEGARVTFTPNRQGLGTCVDSVCNELTSVTELPIGEVLGYLRSNPLAVTVDGIHRDNQITIYPTATLLSLMYFPEGSPQYFKAVAGIGKSYTPLTGVGNVVQTLAHETGHQIGLDHGNDMLWREWLIIQRFRGNR